MIARFSFLKTILEFMQSYAIRLKLFETSFNINSPLKFELKLEDEGLGNGQAFIVCTALIAV